MPMYEYHCEACGASFERLQWRDSGTETRCNCGSEKVERIPYSRFAVASSSASGCGDGLCGEGTCGDAAGMGGCCGGACAMN